MRAMAILYVGPHQNPDFESDYHLSPILAPHTLLEKFPPVLLMCGEKDPFVDDSVIFAGRLREAKRAKRAQIQQARRKRGALGESLRMSPTREPSNSGSDENLLLAQSEEDWVQLEVIEGWSDGYLQMTALMSEARDAIEHLAEWMEESFVNHHLLSSGAGNEKPTVDSNVPYAEQPASSETETEEPVTIVPKNRRLSSFTRNRDDVITLPPNGHNVSPLETGGDHIVRTSL